ncbi:uncharacterized protein LY89DRAFT_711879 [Mollisia scopiformis]|uniref:Sodium/calcium exchanger membrane region domain-containing protein n=1 Tax=Mollisia scopiformis TaxID=149040 RepID=A0A132B8D0_MOLSC|nr:uncharacterized protein LY89DRAFT_711879 [Mollisia scopiformis]KUJ08134.1 hypothetical protein LY89DRAFT_711879 [Mollisia scopiformis]
MDWENFVLNCCAFVAGLYLLHYGEDLFVDHLGIVAKRFKIPETLVVLLTVGAEWEELAIVIAAIYQHQPSLALGNVVGSCIANVLGAFGFGLLVHDFLPRFDRNSKVYAGALLIVSSVYLYLALTGHLDLTGGIFFLVMFAVYLVSICSAIYDNILSPPPGPTVNFPTPDTMEESSPRSEDTLDEFHRELHISIFPTILQCHPDESTPLVRHPDSSTISLEQVGSTTTLNGILYHAIRMFIGLLALTISAYLLVHASSSLASALYLPPTTFGISLLSFFTTIPEKIPVAYATWRGHSRVMVASTAGANIFLLSLCSGLIFVSGNGHEELAKDITAFEVWVVWICSLLLMLIVFVRGRKWMGGILLGFYTAFIAGEITGGLGKS